MPTPPSTTRSRGGKLPPQQAEKWDEHLDSGRPDPEARSRAEGPRTKGRTRLACENAFGVGEIMRNDCGFGPSAKDKRRRQEEDDRVRDVCKLQYIAKMPDRWARA